MLYNIHRDKCTLGIYIYFCFTYVLLHISNLKSDFSRSALVLQLVPSKVSVNFHGENRVES